MLQCLPLGTLSVWPARLQSMDDTSKLSGVHTGYSREWYVGWASSSLKDHCGLESRASSKQAEAKKLTVSSRNCSYSLSVSYIPTTRPDQIPPRLLVICKCDRLSQTVYASAQRLPTVFSRNENTG